MGVIEAIFPVSDAVLHRESEGRDGQHVSDGIERSVDAEPEGPRGQEVAKEGRLDGQ